MILSSFGRRLIALADAAAIKAALGISSSTTVDNSNWSGTDLSVDNGGTGRSSHTAYAVICGGTAATGPQQSVASVGTSGHVLTSNGAGALPTYQAVPTVTPDYAAGNAALARGGIGTYGLFVKSGAGNLTEGLTIAGSSLVYAVISNTATLSSAGSPSGTWRNLGPSIPQNYAGLFLRIS